MRGWRPKACDRLTSGWISDSSAAWSVSADLLDAPENIAFAGRANAAPMNVESHSGESITGDLMTKAG
jgi:hypothetical protein